MSIATDTAAPSKNSTGLVAAATAIVALTGAILGAHQWGELATVAAVVLVATGAVFGFVVPRALRKPSAGGTTLALAIPAFLLALPAFWSGLPLVLGAAAAVVGNAGRRAPRGGKTCIAGFVLGLLAVMGYLGLYLYDSIVNGLSGFLVP